MILSFSTRNLTTRSQKRKAVAELVSGQIETSSAENGRIENCVAGPSLSAELQSGKLDEIKTSLRKKIMSDLTKILADNQEKMLKLTVPAVKTPIILQNVGNSDSEPGTVFPNTTST